MASGSNSDTLDLNDSGIAGCSTPVKPKPVKPKSIKPPSVKNNGPPTRAEAIANAKKLVDEGKEKDAHKSLFDSLLQFGNDESRIAWTGLWIDLDKYIENKTGRAILLSFDV